MMYIYALYDECHGIIGYYANASKAIEHCKPNAHIYGIDPATTKLDYDNENYWGWDESYVKRIEVIE